jgi:melibiose permease
MAVIPIIGLIIAFFWFKKRYTLTDARLVEIENELNARHKEA